MRFFLPSRADFVMRSRRADLDNGFAGYPQDKNLAIDIDDEEDWYLAD